VTTYIGTSASEPVANHPRGTFRVVIERRPFWQRGIAESVRSWPSIVTDVLERSASVAASPLGSPDRVISPDAGVAVIDYRATARPGAATVASIVAAIERSSDYIDVKSIEKGPGVPALSDGGADAFNADRDRAQDEAERQDAAESLPNRIGDTLAGIGKGIRTTVVAGAVIALVIAAVIYLPRGKAAS
jgi:hypothetical protein